MRSSSISVRFELAALALATACSSSSSAPDAGSGCTVDASGNLTDHAELASCAAIATDDAGLAALTIDAATPSVARLSVSIELGASASATTLSSDTVTAWSADALAGAANCTFQAGGASVPAGSFTLTLDSTAPPHGSLSLVTYVHAPPTTDCGYGDLENFSIRF